MEKRKKTRGRPRIAKANLKRNMVTMRMRDALKANLEKMAAANQRSLSEEIEHQLEEREVLRGVTPRFGRPELFWVGHMVASIINHIEKKSGKLWDEDRDTNDECLKAVVMALGNIARAQAGEPPVFLDAGLGSSTAQIAAKVFLDGKPKSDKEKQS